MVGRRTGNVLEPVDLGFRGRETARLPAPMIEDA